MSLRKKKTIEQHKYSCSSIYNILAFQPESREWTFVSGRSSGLLFTQHLKTELLMKPSHLCCSH